MAESGQMDSLIDCPICLETLKPGANESKKKHETRNKKQNGLAHSRFIVCVTLKQKKNIA